MAALVMVNPDGEFVECGGSSPHGLESGDESPQGSESGDESPHSTLGAER